MREKEGALGHLEEELRARGKEIEELKLAAARERELSSGGQEAQVRWWNSWAFMPSAFPLLSHLNAGRRGAALDVVAVINPTTGPADLLEERYIPLPAGGPGGPQREGVPGARHLHHPPLQPRGDARGESGKQKAKRRFVL